LEGRGWWWRWRWRWGGDGKDSLGGRLVSEGGEVENRGDGWVGLRGGEPQEYWWSPNGDAWSCPCGCGERVMFGDVTSCDCHIITSGFCCKYRCPIFGVESCDTCEREYSPDL
jgi:hypothetical protein